MSSRILEILIVSNVILSVLGFAGLIVGGNFGDFIRGMMPGVLLGMTILAIIMMRAEKRR
ncbi:MAG: hypothetical protein PUA82_05995 [Eubacteriales bacterium]|nr:hypothetical protein [Eubacteriales bacterium]